jgi:O-antigen ligase
MERTIPNTILLAAVVLLFSALAVAGALLAGRFESTTALLVIVAVLAGLVVFFKTEWAIYLLILSMLLSPEMALSGISTGAASLGRGVTFRFDDFLLLIVGLAWLIRSAVYKDTGILRRTPLNAAMGLYIVACAVATLWGAIEGRVQLLTGSLFVAKYSQYFVLFFLVINNIHNEKDLRRCWIAVVATALIVATVGMAQIPSGERVSAPFEGEHAEPNTFGGYLLFLMLICLALFLGAPASGRGFFYLAAAACLLIPLLFTLSRASYLGLLPGLLVVLFLSRGRKLATFLLVLILVVALVPELLPRAVRRRVEFTWTQNPSREGTVQLFGKRMDTSTSERLASFVEVLGDFPNRPILGYGVTGWRFLDAQYFRTLIETGLIGITAFFFLVASVLSLGWRRMQDFEGSPFYRSLAVGYLGGTVGLLFHAIGSNTFIIVRIMQPFWLVTGLVYMSRLVVEAGRTSSPDLEGTGSRGGPRLAAIRTEVRSLGMPGERP